MWKMCGKIGVRFFFFKKPISLFTTTCDGADITRKKEKGLKKYTYDLTTKQEVIFWTQVQKFQNVLLYTKKHHKLFSVLLSDPTNQLQRKKLHFPARWYLATVTLFFCYLVRENRTKVTTVSCLVWIFCPPLANENHTWCNVWELRWSSCIGCSSLGMFPLQFTDLPIFHVEKLMRWQWAKLKRWRRILRCKYT